jgi:serine/threonine protein kinase/tetratricopeptide (TPR) repeat protein
MEDPNPRPARPKPEEEPARPGEEETLLGSHADNVPPPLLAEKGDGPSVFSPGQTVAERFRVVKFVARGGMGEVYEAEDLELGERVALKTIHVALRDRSRTVERFRREIVMAKRVTHPNVCRTFDFFRHRRQGEDGEPDVLVVSMELLRGESLDQLLRRKGRLSAEEALPLVKQMAAGLHAAHLAGIVHRDFKSNNVMLTSSPGAPSGIRAVITDFGLAHSAEGERISLTSSADLVGTPAYMAPEQLQGGAITAATDIYALGVVMFQMVTGKLPFVGETPLAMAIQRLELPPPVPKALEPDLDARWSETILKCLERSPADRFASVEEIEPALVGERKLVLRAERDSARARRRVWLTGAAVATLAAIAVYLGTHYRATPVRGKRPAVLVLGFKNLSGDPSLNPWGEQFATNLGSMLDADEIHYISAESLAWKAPPPDEMPAEPSRELLSKLRGFGCDYVVAGSYSVVGAPGSRRIQWNIRLLKSSTGENQGSVPIQLTEAELLDVIPRAGEQVREKLGVTIPEAARTRLPQKLPANEKASEAYAAGIERLRQFDYAAAKERFLVAVEQDPTNAEIRSALAGAWWELGYEAKAQQQAKMAQDQSNGLSLEKSGMIKGRYLAYTKQWGEAAKLYQSLWNLDPGTATYALLLSKSFEEGNRLREALETLDKLQENGALPDGVQAQSNLQLAQLQQKLGNYPAGLDAANAAAEKAKSIGAGLLEARSEIQACLAQLDLGKVKEAAGTCAGALALNVKEGDLLGTARAKNAVANAYWAQGALDKAEGLYREALDIATRIGDKRDEAGARLNLGLIQQSKNNLAEARKWYEQSIRVSLERGGQNDDLLLAKQSLATVVGAMGDPRRSTELLEEVAKEAESAGDRSRLAIALNNLCAILLQTGKVALAKKDCQESLKLREEMADKPGQARSHGNLGDVLEAAGDLAGAENHYREELRIQQELGAQVDAAYTEVSLASLAVEGRKPQDAIAGAQKALQVFSEEKDTDGEALARTTLSQAYLATGNGERALPEAAAANDLAQKSADRTLRAMAVMQLAKVEYQKGNTAAAKASLLSVEKEMKEMGLVGLALEARLHRARAMPLKNEGAARKQELATVAAEAKTRGYLLLERKAREALRGS